MVKVKLIEEKHRDIERCWIGKEKGDVDLPYRESSVRARYIRREDVIWRVVSLIFSSDFLHYELFAFICFLM